MKDYKTILEGVVNIINTTEKSDIGFANICTYIGENCPDLADSEDEKIRKELIKFVKVNIPDEERYIAWLEKQGEHKKFRDSIQVGDKVTRNQDGVLVNLSQLKRVAKPAEKQGEQKDILEDAIIDSNEDGLVAETIRCKKEKQGEQKPADKVEPKFRIGDVIEVKPMKCQGKIFTGKPNKIVDITEKSYILDDGKAYNIELQDGLKLSEQKSTEWSEEDEKNSLDIKCLIGSYRAGDTEYRLDSWIDSLKDRVQPQPKQEWSEEDEHRVKDTIYFLDTAKKHYASTVELDTCIDWLKSLKDRYTWKPSDEMLEALYKVIPENVMAISEDEMLLDKLYQGLKYGRVLSNN